MFLDEHAADDGLEMTQAQLAGPVSASRQSVDHILKEFEMSGSSRLRYRSIEILDPQQPAALLA